MRSYHKGSAHVVVIIILVVALVGALGFVFYQNFIEKKPAEQKTADTAKDTPAKTDTTPKADETNYLVIKEWGVKLPAEGVLEGAAYYTDTVQNTDGSEQLAVYLTTTKLRTLAKCDSSEASCASAGGALERGKADDTFYGGAGQSIGKYKDYGTRVGDYYYSRTGPQASSFEAGPDQDYEVQVSKAYIEAFNKLSLE